MDAARVNEILAIHEGRVTNTTHLGAVARLAAWAPEEILEYQQFLVEAILAGRYVIDSAVAVLTLGNGLTVTQQTRDMWLGVLAVKIARGYEVEETERDLETLRVWDAAPAPRQPIPEGLLGLPLGEMSTTFLEQARGEDEKAVARVVKGWITDTHVNWDGANEIMREAPWAYRRLTGVTPPGVPLSSSEEFHETGRLSWFSVVIVAARGAERLEISEVSYSPSEGMAIQTAHEYLRGILRSLKARIVRTSVISLELEGEQDGWRFHDGDVIAHPVPTVSLAGGALRDDFMAALFAKADDPKLHPRMPDDEFWKLFEPATPDFDEAKFEQLTVRLSKLGQQRIIGFAETLADKLYELDRPDLMYSSPPDGVPSMSSDVFLYVRCAIVASGVDSFSRVLTESSIDESEWMGELGELLLSVAPDAWIARRGEDFDHETAVSYETGSNKIAWGDASQEAIQGVYGYAVVSGLQTEDGDIREIVRFWEQTDPEAAKTTHDNAESARLRERYLGILGLVPLPNPDILSPVLTMSRIAFYRSVAS